METRHQSTSLFAFPEKTSCCIKYVPPPPTHHLHVVLSAKLRILPYPSHQKDNIIFCTFLS